MQKFADETIEILYEYVILGEGRKFEYPWHQYYSDTDCIWMGTALHPAS
jgi:hypothetical protein